MFGIMFKLGYLFELTHSWCNPVQVLRLRCVFLALDAQVAAESLTSGSVMVTLTDYQAAVIKKGDSLTQNVRCHSITLSSHPGCCTFTSSLVC